MHYTCLVIDDNPEEALEPFCEDLETEGHIEVVPLSKVDDMCKHYIDSVPREIEELLGHTIEDVDGLSTQDKITIHEEMGQRWSGGEDHTFDGMDFVKTVTYNYDGRWDWYSIGGRWSGSLILKEGATTGRLGDVGVSTSLALGSGELTLEELQSRQNGRADQALIRDIDWDAMEAEAKFLVLDKWDQIDASIEGLEIPTENWPEFLERYESEGKVLEEARDAWKELEIVKATSGLPGFFASDIVSQLREGREEQIQQAVNGVYSWYAVIYEGKWISDTEYFGPFGFLTNDESKNIKDVLMSLPGDTMITVVDCHA